MALPCPAHPLGPQEACHVLRGTEGSGAVMRLGAAAGEALWGTVAAGDVAGFRAALEAVRAVPTAVGYWVGGGEGEGRRQGGQRGGVGAAGCTGADVESSWRLEGCGW